MNKGCRLKNLACQPVRRCRLASTSRSRGCGRTWSVLMATGHSVNIPEGLFDSVRALTATIAAELGETAVGSEHYQALFAIGIFLFIITFIINLCADLIVRGIRES